MRILWSLFKVILGLAIAIPVGIFALAATVGLVGALVVLAIMVLKLALVALLVVGGFKLARAIFGAKPAEPAKAPALLTTPKDLYYEAAMREINSEIGLTSR